MWNLAILLVAEFILLILAFLLFDQDVFSPSVIMCTMFFISTMIALFKVEDWNIDYELKATLIIFSGIVAFILAEFQMKLKFGNSRQNMVEMPHELGLIRVSTAKLLFLLLFDLIVCYLYFLKIRNLVGGGSSLGAIFAAYRRLGISKNQSSDIESVKGIVQQLVKIVRASGYATSYIFINNILNGNEKKINKVLYILIILVSIAPAIMMASRGDIIKLFAAIFVETYILWNQKKGWQINLSWKFIMRALAILIIGIPVFYYSAELLGRSTKLALFDYAAAYLGKSIELFDLYIKNPTERINFGEETFVGLKKVLAYVGIGKASNLSNLEFRNVGGGYGNIYTFFRRPYHDFGIVGMWIFTMCVSVFFSYMYYGKIKNRKRNEKTNKWTMVYGYLFYWILISSLDQYSQTYISAGTAIIIVLILLIYDLLTRVKFTYGNKSSYKEGYGVSGEKKVIKN